MEHESSISSDIDDIIIDEQELSSNVVEETGSLIDFLSDVPYNPYVVSRETITNESLVNIVNDSGSKFDSLVFEDCLFNLDRNTKDLKIDAGNISGLHFRKIGKGTRVPLYFLPDLLRNSCKRLELSDCHHVEAWTGTDFPNLSEFVMRRCEGSEVTAITASNGKLTSIICDGACLGSKKRPDPKLQSSNLSVLWMVHLDHCEISQMLDQVRRGSARDTIEELLISWSFNTSASYENSVDLDAFGSLRRLTLRNLCANAISTRRKAKTLDLFTIYIRSSTPLGDLLAKYGDAEEFRGVLETDPDLIECLPVVQSKFQNMKIHTMVK